MLRNIFILIFSIIFLSGCIFDSKEESLYKFEQNERLHVEKHDIINVFFHNKRKFSVSYLDENNHLQFKTFNSYKININIIVDVNANESNWYETKYLKKRTGQIDSNNNNYVNIHIKDPNIVAAAADKSGKSSYTMVQKIQ